MGCELNFDDYFDSFRNNVRCLSAQRQQRKRGICRRFIWSLSLTQRVTETIEATSPLVDLEQGRWCFWGRFFPGHRPSLATGFRIACSGRNGKLPRTISFRSERYGDSSTFGFQLVRITGLRRPKAVLMTILIVHFRTTPQSLCPKSRAEKWPTPFAELSKQQFSQWPL